MSASFERFIGVDLGGGKGKKTALAVLERRDDGIAVVGLLPRAGDVPLYDGALVAAIRARADRALLCVDAPLGLPPCLRCVVPVCPGQERCVDPAVVEMRRLGGAIVDPTRDHRRGKPAITPYTQRPTEVYLRERRGIIPRETLGQGMGPLTARAMHLMRALADIFRPEENAIEVFPRATLELLRLNEPYKKRADARLRILSRMPGLSFAPGVWREECVQSDHAFDAIVCAYTGYRWAEEGWSVPTDVSVVAARDGWIWVPPEQPGVERSTRPEDPEDLEPRRKTAP
jgi:predicted RNase H-like nuclease